MALQRYLLDWDWKFQVTVDIDRDIATDEKLHEINSFWTGDDYRIEKADGDVLKAVLTMLCTTVLHLSIEYPDVKAIFQRGGMATEGWPPLDGSWGITLVEYDQLDLDNEEVNIREVTHG